MDSIVFDGSGNSYFENIKRAVEGRERRDKIKVFRNRAFDSLKNTLRPSDTLVCIDQYTVGYTDYYSLVIYQSPVPVAVYYVGCDLVEGSVSITAHDTIDRTFNTSTRVIIRAIKNGTIDSLVRPEGGYVLDGTTFEYITVVSRVKNAYTVKYYMLKDFEYRIPKDDPEKGKVGEIVKGIRERASRNPAREKRRQAYRDSLEKAGNTLVFNGRKRGFLDNIKHAMKRSPTLAASHEVLEAQRDFLFRYLKRPRHPLHESDTVIVMEGFCGQYRQRYRPDYHATIYLSASDSYRTYEVNLDYATCSEREENPYHLFHYIVPAIKNNRLDTLLQVYEEAAGNTPASSYVISTIVRKNDKYTVKYRETRSGSMSARKFLDMLKQLEAIVAPRKIE
jgi:hypothetical protein